MPGRVPLDPSPVAACSGGKRYEHRKHEDDEEGAPDKPYKVQWVDMGQGAI
jgi:hypothetical protein